MSATLGRWTVAQNQRTDAAPLQSTPELPALSVTSCSVQQLVGLFGRRRPPVPAVHRVEGQLRLAGRVVGGRLRLLRRERAERVLVRLARRLRPLAVEVQEGAQQVHGQREDDRGVVLGTEMGITRSGDGAGQAREFNTAMKDPAPT